MKISQTDRSPVGTSFHGQTIVTTYAALAIAVGAPDYECNDGSDKCNFNWTLELEDGTLFTIYDWKEYRQLGQDELVEWHIGADNAFIAMRAKEALEKVI